MSAAVAGNQLLALLCIVENAKNVEKRLTGWQSVISCAKVRGGRLMVHHTDCRKEARPRFSTLLKASWGKWVRGEERAGRKAVLRQHKQGRWEWRGEIQQYLPEAWYKSAGHWHV